MLWRRKPVSYTPHRIKLLVTLVETYEPHEDDYALRLSRGRILALDWGSKRIGVAVSDEMRLTVRPLPLIPRTNWKRILRSISQLCSDFDVRTVVIGLPLRLDGSEGEWAAEIRRVAVKMRASLKIPVELQDERLTSKEALSALRDEGYALDESLQLKDSRAATIILTDFIRRLNADELS